MQKKLIPLERKGNEIKYLFMDGDFSIIFWTNANPATIEHAIEHCKQYEKGRDRSNEN